MPFIRLEGYSIGFTVVETAEDRVLQFAIQVSPVLARMAFTSVDARSILYIAEGSGCTCPIYFYHFIHLTKPLFNQYARSALLSYLASSKTLH